MANVTLVYITDSCEQLLEDGPELALVLESEVAQVGVWKVLHHKIG